MAMIGGRTVGPVRCHYRGDGATAVALRQKGGSMAVIGPMGCGFRSYYRFRCC